MANRFIQKLSALPNQLYGRKTRGGAARFKRQAERAVQQLLHAGIDSFQDLAELARDATRASKLRATACWFLARLDARQAAPVLLDVLKGNSASLWMQAATDLALTGSRRALGPLLAMLRKAQHGKRREAVVYALSWLGDRRAATPLLAILRDNREASRVRAQAAEGLGMLEYRPALAPLINTLESRSAEIRFWSAYTLARLGDPRAIPPLQRVAATDNATIPGWWSVKREARWAIREIRSTLRRQATGR